MGFSAAIIAFIAFCNMKHRNPYIILPRKYYFGMIIAHYYHAIQSKKLPSEESSLKTVSLYAFIFANHLQVVPNLILIAIRNAKISCFYPKSGVASITTSSDLHFSISKIIISFSSLSIAPGRYNDF